MAWRLALGLVVSVVVSLFGAWVGRRLLDTMNEPLPVVLDALHDHADPPVESPRSPSPSPLPSRRLVVVLVDGLGEAPFRALLSEGALDDVAWRATLDSGVPSLSRPAYHAILTGVPQWASGIRANQYTSGRADSVAERVRSRGRTVAWMLQTVPWFHELFGAPEDVFVQGPSVTSADAFQRVWDTDPSLLVIHLTGVDNAGHSRGAGSDEYVAAARQALAIVRSFRALTLGAPEGDRAIWFVGADHGHMPRGGHGGPEAAVRRTLWVALSREPLDGEAPGDPPAPITALAPTFARVLGVEAPRDAIADGLPFAPRVFGPPLHASDDRVEAVEQAHRAYTDGVLRSASSRAGLVAALAGAVLVMMVRLRRRRGLAEVACAAAAITAFVVAGPGLSLSAVRTEAWFVERAVIVMVLAAAPVWWLVRERASLVAAALVSAVPPAAALLVTRASLGASDATPVEMVLWPSLGFVPGAVCAAIVAVEGAAAGVRRLRG